MKAHVNNGIALRQQFANYWSPRIRRGEEGQKAYFEK